MSKIFQSDTEVPDLCSSELLLPNEGSYLDMAIPREGGNVSPVELSWLLLDKKRAGNARLMHLHDQLTTAAMLGKEAIEEVHRTILDGTFLNHNLRVIARIALDPRRCATFDFAEAYDMDKTKRYPVPDERPYFEKFHNTYGVVQRPDIET